MGMVCEQSRVGQILLKLALVAVHKLCPCQSLLGMVEAKIVEWESIIYDAEPRDKTSCRS